MAMAMAMAMMQRLLNAGSCALKTRVALSARVHPPAAKALWPKDQSTNDWD
jgi:hypothetical protein